MTQGLSHEWEFRQLLTHAVGPDDDPDVDGSSDAGQCIAGTFTAVVSARCLDVVERTVELQAGERRV